MGLWDNVSNFLSGGGRDDIDDGYNEANEYLSPYRTQGAKNYNQMQANTDRYGRELDQYGNPADRMYRDINQSPNDFYEKIMRGYSESPGAKYEQEQALRASNSASAASGMIGSGAQLKAVQQNAADISNRDRDRYYGNVRSADQMQTGYLQNFQGEKDKQRAMLQYLTQLGYGASTGMGQNSIARGNAEAGVDQGAFDGIAGLAGLGGQNYKNNSMSNAGGGKQIPWYMMLM